MDDLTEDQLGQACLEQRDVIRLFVNLAKDRVREWEPAPCPELYGPAEEP